MAARNSSRKLVSSSASCKQVLLVDDHPLVREAVATLIRPCRDLAVAGEAECSSEVMQILAARKVDLVLLDISLGGASGIDLIKDLHARYPEVRILVLSMHDESLYAERALHAGAQGYIMKQQPGTVVLEAIRRVLDGEVYVSQAIVSEMLKQHVAGHVAGDHRSGVERLSDRELSVFSEIGNGLSSAEIAVKLHLSIKTIQTYRQHIRQKLGLRHSADMVRRATEWALLEATTRA